MRSYQITEWGQPLAGSDYPTPQPEGAEVLVEVSACGLCHSDLHIHQGYFDLGDGKRLNIADRGMELPFTMGHEVAGTVVAMGPEAEGVAIGDSRVVYPWIGCGTCKECLRGEELLCLKPRVIGTWVHGGYASHVLVPHGRYLVDHGGIPVEVACTYACSGVTAYSAIHKADITRTDQSLLIVGAGGVGMNALLMAKAVLGCKVFVADLDPVKREAALATGLCAGAFDNGAEDAVREIKHITGGGVDAAIDFVGRPDSLGFAMAAGKQKGATVVVVGLYGSAMPLSTAMLPLRMMSLKGSYVGTLQDLHDVMALAKAGSLPPLQVSPCPLHDVNEAMRAVSQGEVVGRVILKP